MTAAIGVNPASVGDRGYRALVASAINPAGPRHSETLSGARIVPDAPRLHSLITMIVALLGLAALALFGTFPLAAQATPPVRLTIEVRRDSVPAADVLVRAAAIGRYTDDRGIAMFSLPAGAREIITSKIGFQPETLYVDLHAGRDTTVTIHLSEQPPSLSAVTVSATRTGRRIEDEPLRVETLGEEEVEEKLLMTPGDITMMLNETAGLRVQTTSPSLGGANVRVQGMRGRYTQILTDGLPLYGGQTGGLGLLQIPPMDLGGVEIIKGVASALYGGSALGGVINLISRRPEGDPVRELLLNQTTFRATDAVGFASEQLSERWGYTVLAGGHRQSQIDRDEDGWTDLPGYERTVVRPRVFWETERGHSIMLTGGATFERREGGTLDDRTAPDGSAFPERLRTSRYDAGLVGGVHVGEGAILSLRAAGALQRHRHTFGTVLERDEHTTGLAEGSITLPFGRSLWVMGVAVQQERYRAADVPGFDYTFTTPGVFVQTTVTPGAPVSLTGSVRLDEHSEYGMQIAPRVSALLRFGPVWTLRLSGGGGYFAPTPFTEETEVIGLMRLEPLADVGAERARSASIDLGGAAGPLELNVTVFASEIDHPLGLREASGVPDRVELVNAARPTRASGTELLVRWNPEPFHVTASNTLVWTREEDPQTGGRRMVPLTPRHQAGIVTMWESEGVARSGIEIYYTGKQSLDDNPYRDESRPYVHIGVLAERRFGAARVFINAENLLGYRQTRYDPLVLPQPGLGGRWTTDVWGPLEGRVANIGMRLDVR